MDRQRPLIKGLGLRVLALGLVKVRQIVEAVGHIRVLRAQRLFTDRQRPLQKGRGIGITSTFV
jgi:hypothetical protein